MKYIVALLAVLVTCEAFILAEKQQWIQFKKKFKRNYKSRSADNERFSVFRDNLRAIEKHNDEADRGVYTYRMGINQFSDLTSNEFSAMLKRTMGKLPKRPQQILRSKFRSLPKTKDWRKEGAVTPVKEQGYCGSCWAFSANCAVESLTKIKSGYLPNLSEQHLVDCDNTSYGCGGGLMEYAFDYMMSSGGVHYTDDYPYEEDDGECRFDPSKPLVSIDGYESIEPFDEKCMLEVVAQQPVCIAICADLLQMYSSGILQDDRCCKTISCLNHAVTIIGYGVTNDRNRQYYFIAKNSWGKYWGEQGYFRIMEGRNQCGIAQYMVYPIKSNSTTHP